jgi:dolichyl-phosphate-mannose--protein O-mannosyl transferase
MYIHVHATTYYCIPLYIMHIYIHMFALIVIPHDVYLFTWSSNFQVLVKLDVLSVFLGSIIDKADTI